MKTTAIFFFVPKTCDYRYFSVNVYKIKANFTLEQATKAQRARRGIAQAASVV
jgi:hypothetical protein